MHRLSLDAPRHHGAEAPQSGRFDRVPRPEDQSAGVAAEGLGEQQARIGRGVFDARVAQTGT
ncbi:hypothetical protein Sa4125_36320 [Aureimonas sp. SA4125]|nr:hypothetical protein Sa4125_36320 [Aureimonas sp. SA4125]